MRKSDSTALTLKLFGALALSLTLVACGGNDSSRLDGIDTGDGTNNPPDGDDSDGVVDGGQAQLGRGSGDNFVAGEIEVGIGEGVSLAPGGRTELSVSLVDGANELVTSPVSVGFNSDCLASGAATLVGSAEGENSVETSNGFATVTYQANGCVGQDQITARATYEGESAGNARATLTVEADSIQSLTFMSAEPELISLKGTGGLETSTVTFQVLGSTGSPMRDAEVEFSLSPSGTGGLALVNSTDTSNSNGEVSTTVQSGSVATSVRVTASTSTDVGTIATQSDKLVVSTGIPDQNSTDVGASDLFPTDAWRVNGVESQLSIRLADAFNNPAPDGTAVTFTTSGGAIDSSCTTTNGTCSVTWRSQNPRPRPSQGFHITDERQVICPTEEECRPGRVQVLAAAQGNESFIDRNGNGVYNQTDIFLTQDDNPESNRCARSRPPSYADIDELGCDDLGTAYVDKNFSGIHNEDEEIVVLTPDEGSDGSEYRPGDGIYNGVLCSDEAFDAGACNRESVTVRDEVMLVMTCSQPYFMDDGRLPGQHDVELAPGQSATVTMLLADCNGNGMPAGTTLEVNDELANNVEAAIFPDGELAGSADPGSISVVITAADDPEDAAGGVVFVSITAPTQDGELTTSPAGIGISAPPPEEEE